MHSYLRGLVWTIGVVALVLGSFSAAAAAEAPTYTKDIAPILFDRCASCHRDGEIAPMSLMSYTEVRPWARAIKTKVVSREMPPWHADPTQSLPFRNDVSLSQEQIDTIVAWVEAGAPKGDDANMPKAPTFLSGWQHPSGRAPDVVVSMPVDYEVPADGMIPYVNFFGKIDLPTDVFAEAIEARPGNRAVVHHMTASASHHEQAPPPGPFFSPVDATAPKPFERDRQAAQGGGEGRQPRAVGGVTPSGVTGLYTPGQGFEQFPEGYGKRVAGGDNAYMNFNMHYQLTGKPETDRSVVGIWLHKGPVKYEMVRNTGTEGTVLAEGREIMFDPTKRGAPLMYAELPNIPPHTPDFQTTIVTPFSEATTIYQFNPHAHLRGKEFTYRLVYADGREQTVLHVPRYDFNWQMIYQLEEPLTVPAGTKLVVTAKYDNSAKNRYNPAPDREVVWAEQSWEEMFVPFVMYSVETEEPQQDSTQD